MSFFKDKDKIVAYCDKIIEIFLYTLIFCLPFSKAIIEISATFVILAWIIKKIFTRRLVSTYLNIPIFVYIMAIFLSVVFSSNFALSIKNFCTKTMEYIMLYFIVAEFVCDKRRLKNTVIVMIASAAMIGIDCLFQYFMGFDFLRLRHLEAGRITGSFQMPGDLAGFLGPLLCLPLSLSFLNFKKGIKSFLRIESILLLSLLVFSFTRGAWLGLIVAVCFLGALENKRIFYLTVSFLLIFAVIIPHLTEALGTFDNILQRVRSIFTFADTANLDRKAIWQAAIRMIKDKPLFGHGFTTFMGNYSRYGQDHRFLTYGLIPYAHNCYLQIAAETGIIGLASFLWLIGTFFVKSIASLLKTKDRFHHAILSGISAGIIVTLVHSAVDTNLYSLPLSVLFWFMLGLNAALQQNFAVEKA